MQKNAFHEIWTLLSRTFLQGRHACGCNKVQGLAWCAYSKGIPKDRIQMRKGWRDAIDYSYERKAVFLLKLPDEAVCLFCDDEHKCRHIESF